MVEAGLQRLRRDVGDVGHHPGHLLPVPRHHPALGVAPAVELRVGHDRLARHRGERDVLRAQPRRGRHHDRALDAPRLVDHPLQDLHAAHRAAHGGVQGLDAQVVEQPAVAGDQVGDVQQREVEVARLPRRRVDAHRAGGARAAAQDVGRDDEEPVGVDRLARPDHPVPPARLRGVRVLPAPVAGRVRVTGQRVADEHHVVARRRQLAVGLVDHLDVLEALAATQPQRVVLGGEDDPLGHGVEERAAHWLATTWWRRGPARGRR